MAGQAGAWKLHEPGKPEDGWTIVDSEFRVTYRPVGEDSFERTGVVEARPARPDEEVQTEEGTVLARSGDWIVRRDTGFHWVVPSDKFGANYGPAAHDGGNLMTKLVNYTPHAELTYRPDGGEPVVLSQQGNARCSEEYLPGGTFRSSGLPLTLMSYGDVTGLPDPADGVTYVVSQLVVGACPDREDLAFPAGLVRDDAGTIIGFRYLARPAPPNPS